MVLEIPVQIEFTGGLEAFFSRRRKHKLSIPPEMTIARLVPYLVQTQMTDPRPEFFIQDEALRPGILVLINDADWELEGGPAYQLQPRDHITFMSTLHGG